MPEHLPWGWCWEQDPVSPCHQLQARAADEPLGFGFWSQVPKSSWLSAAGVGFKLWLSPFEGCPLLQT